MEQLNAGVLSDEEIGDEGFFVEPLSSFDDCFNNYVVVKVDVRISKDQ